jgi:cysteine desulfurase/selenocysteine lyase
MTPVAENLSYRSLFSGLDVEVPLLDNKQMVYVNFDNAASTPAMLPVLETVDRFLTYYSSVHRGTGFKSQISTYTFEQVRRMVLDWVGANPRTHVCVFGKNTTEAINKLARRFPFRDGRDVVLVSMMEHHSNDLPWRAVAHVVHVTVTPDGRLDEADFDAKLKQYGDRLALVAITGASNVTGFLNPIHRLAAKAHAVGAEFLADCAQLAPHRAVNMRSLDDPEHLDYITISAHKMYAPFGMGALIGRREPFEEGAPDMRGGGQVEIVTVDDVIWSPPPEREEAGSPNTVGAVAMAAAIRQLTSIGMNKVARHEAELTAYTLRKLKSIPGIHLYGDTDPERTSDRLGVIPFNIEGISHFKTAAILGFEFGIGVRNGCFCAHPYLLSLMGLNHEQAQDVRRRIMAGDRSDMPGLVRVSFGLYNTMEEVDILVEALPRIVKGEYKGNYYQDKASGEYFPEGWQVKFEDYFTL